MNDRVAPSGILLVDKPAGLTSHDVVNRVRSLFGTRRVGHAGTLDPFATGLLVMLLGQATRLSEYLTAEDKGYSGLIQLGVTTDTGDRTGTVTGGSPCSVTADSLERVRRELVGVSEQMPPMYSAVRVGGRRLHQLARLGQAVERRPRRVAVHELTLDIASSGDFPQVVFQVYCSKGTYVRVLAEDVGGRLGCGAHVLELRRQVSGCWRLADAIELEALARLSADDRTSRLIPLADALPDIPAVSLRWEDVDAVRKGMAVETLPPADFAEKTRDGSLARLLTPAGELAAVALVNREEAAGVLMLQPKKVFLS